MDNERPLTKTELELVMLYARIAYADGFRDGARWVPDGVNTAAQEAAYAWTRDREAALKADLAGDDD